MSGHVEICPCCGHNLTYFEPDNLAFECHFCGADADEFDCDEVFGEIDEQGIGGRRGARTDN